MGYLLPQYKQAIIEDIISSVTVNTANYYVFAANPVPYSGNPPTITYDDYTTTFTNDWNMLFGKIVANSQIYSMIKNIQWQTNTVYSRYDNTDPNLANENFYVVVPPSTLGGAYNIFKCIDNANSSPSIRPPDQIQATSFTKSDGYTWRYITSIANFDYQSIATSTFIPVYPNTSVQTGAYSKSGIEVVNVINAGSGYVAHSYGLNANRLTVTSVNGTFHSGDYVYQTAGNANASIIASGYIFTTNTTPNSSTLDVRLTGTAQFSNLYPLYNATNSSVNAAITSSNNYGSNNFIQAVVNSTVIQIGAYESAVSGFYTNSSIYFYNTTSPTGQIKTIVNYQSNLSGNFVYLDSPANTQQITFSTQYLISPKVVFQTDARTSSNSTPLAYCVVNPSTNNGISNVVMIDVGSGASWANVTFQTNTSTGGAGATAYAIVPPAGGHGANPANELFVQGIGIAFNFSNNEANTIPENVQYNKIGLFRDPYVIDSNTGLKTSTLYGGNTFTSYITANVSPSTTFTVGDTVTGANSGAFGTVAFSNGSVLYITGDKYFANESITNSTGLVSANIVINSSNSTYFNRGSIYTKDIMPLYIQNINNVNRSSGRVETYKLIIQI